MLSKNFATDKNESNSFERFFVRYIQNVMMGTSANKLYQFLKLSSVSNWLNFSKKKLETTKDTIYKYVAL